MSKLDNIKQILTDYLENSQDGNGIKQYYYSALKSIEDDLSVLELIRYSLAKIELDYVEGELTLKIVGARDSLKQIANEIMLEKGGEKNE